MQAVIDPQLQQVLRQVAAIEADSPAWGLPEAERRRRVSELSAQCLPALRLPGMQRSDAYAGAPGREIPLRLYRSAGAPERPRLMPYFHGGGWVVGSIATHDALCAELAERTGYLVASVHYRRAPENPHPAQHEDAWEAVAWLSRHADPLGADGRQPMALGGDSAGANVALGCALRAQRESAGLVDRMLLLYPALDPDPQLDIDSKPQPQAGSMHGGRSGLQPDSRHGPRTGEPSGAASAERSLQLYRDGPGLTQASMDYYWSAFLGGAAPEQADPLALPLRWPADLRLPPAVLVTAEIDLLRDEGEAYARRLAAAGVQVEHWRAAGMVHGFARMLTASAAARRHVRRACRELVKIGEDAP